MSNLTPSVEKVFQSWLLQITQTEKNLPQITHASEIWANKVIKEGGEVYATGNFGFWRECVHRAGGIGFIRKLTPDVVLDNKDVVLAGFEYADETHRREILEPVLKSGATVLLFAELGAEKEFNHIKQSPNQLILIPCEKNLDGLLSTDSEKYVSLTGMTNILHLWVTSAEFIGACTRLGHMPNIYVSVFHPRGWSINGSYFASRFCQDKQITPVEKGVLGKQYLDWVKKINMEIVGENSISTAANWIVDTLNNNHGIHETIAGHWAPQLNSNKYSSKYLNSVQRVNKGDLRLALGYNYFPNNEIDKYLNEGINVIFMCTSNITFTQAYKNFYRK